MGSVWLTDLADACRTSGLHVIEEPGWRTRGHGGMDSRPQSIIAHHTAAPARTYATNPYPSLKTVRDGRNLGTDSELPGPLAQLGLQRNCAVRVIAAGRAYHAGVVFETWQNNYHALGIEAEHDGVSSWPGDLYDAYARLVAALRVWYKVPLPRCLGHKEVAKPLGRKPDPNFNMTAFRTRVSTHTPKPAPTPPPTGDLTMADAASIEDKIDALADTLGARYDVDAGRYRVYADWNAGDVARDQADAQRDAAEMGLLSQLGAQLTALRAEVAQLTAAVAKLADPEG